MDSDQIIVINLEQLEYEHLLDYHKLHDEVLARAKPGKMNYVFIDEVQNVPEFQRAVDSLYTRDNLDLYITGSNALMLRGTLATLLSGRYVEVVDAPPFVQGVLWCIGCKHVSAKALRSIHLHGRDAGCVHADRWFFEPVRLP